MPRIGALRRAIVRIALLLGLVAAIPVAHAAPCAIGTPGATVSVVAGDTGRSMLLHLPAGFRPGRAAPLVLLLHGSLGKGAKILKTSRFEQTADRHGFIVAAPDAGIPAGEGFVWNIPGIPTLLGKIPSAQDANDAAFLIATVDWLVAQRCVDRHRVYVTGFSGGGRMTSWLACHHAERFAAIAPVVGLRAGIPLPADPKHPDPKSCRPSRPMPVIAFAGDKDAINPVAGGGNEYWQYPMRAAEARWAELNHCAGPLKTRALSPTLYEDRIAKCRGGADVLGRVMIGGGHEWLADNEAMWAFLSRHRR